MEFNGGWVLAIFEDSWLAYGILVGRMIGWELQTTPLMCKTETSRLRSWTSWRKSHRTTSTWSPADCASRGPAHIATASASSTNKLPANMWDCAAKTFPSWSRITAPIPK
ncbi:Uncharacterized protein Fot_19724 [Forsythia ovata]|uniref:Uncharacterized protein n=1 Tax=Forsythia ovata TaxID=205694 RepID=A0ABD1VLY8_9LAMI